MDENSPTQASPQATPLPMPPVAVPPASQPTQTIICPQCHQLVPTADYFCPNCGKKLNEPPLSTSVATQTWIYILSVVLPLIAFLAIKYWPGIKYARSDDPKAKEIGYIAVALLVVSTIIAVWLSLVWTNQAIQSALSGVNSVGNF